MGALVLAGCSEAADEVPAEPTIIVSGASGQLGGLVVEDLLALGVQADRLILVSRTPEELEPYAAMGASTRFGDFTQPESLAEAYAGGDRMLLISINTGLGGERVDLHGTAIDAAVAAGVGHIVYTSFVDLENNDSPIANDHRATEQLLRESGVAWTMLRNSLYMDGLVGRAVGMLEAGAATVPPGEAPVAYVAREDCAAAAAAVLAGAGHEFQVYDITGPSAIGTADIAAAASEVTGRTVEVTPGEGEPPAAPAPGAASYMVVSSAVADLTGRPAMTVVNLLEGRRDELP